MKKNNPQSSCSNPFAASPTPPVHKLPSFGEPTLHYQQSTLRLGNNDMAVFPFTLAEDIHQAPTFELTMREVTPIGSDMTEDPLVEILLFRDGEERSCFYKQDLLHIDSLDTGTISLNGALSQLTPGSYTLYVSGVKPCMSGHYSHEHHTAVYRFHVVTQNDARNESSFNGFKVRVPKGQHPMVSQGLWLTFYCEKHSNVLPHHLFCFTENGVLMCKFDIVCNTVIRTHLTSPHQWMPGIYFLVADNGLMPVSGAAFEIQTDGTIVTADGLFDLSAAYRLTRIMESDPSGATSVMNNLESNWNTAYSERVLDWYDHNQADKMCHLYGCPTIYDDGELKAPDADHVAYRASQAMDVIIRILDEKKAKLSDQAKLKAALWHLEQLQDGHYWFYSDLDDFCDEAFTNFNIRRMKHLNEHHDNLVEFLSTITLEDIDFECFLITHKPHKLEGFSGTTVNDDDDDDDDDETDTDDDDDDDTDDDKEEEDPMEEDFDDIIKHLVDDNVPAESEAMEKRFKAAMEELNKMIGLTELKNGFSNIFSTTRFNILRTSMGLKESGNTSHHMLFYGNPGTGKTTVAKHLGRIFHALGLLSDGGVLETERKKMVGRYIGETENIMEDLLKKAKGKVLFIDEAYLLCVKQDGENNDYGQRALECLLTKMAEPNPDMVVVMAGYEKELENMLTMNTGLRGRIAHRLHFPDYSASELMEIGELILSREDYMLSEDARQLLQSIVEEAVAHKGPDFSNARWMEQFIHHAILPAMSHRVIALPNIDVKDCQVVTRDDVQKGWEMFQGSYHKNMSAKKMGF